MFDNFAIGGEFMQLGWLQTFMAVYHTGSFTKAAHKLGITQPAVTQHIRGLEGKFGKPLFDRTPQGTVPTSAGVALAYEVQAPIANLNAAICRHFDTSPSNRPVRLGGPAELVTARLMSSISELIATGLEIRISFREAHDLLEDLRTGHLDIVVSTMQPRMRGVDAIALIDEEIALLASPRIADSIPCGALAVDGPEHWKIFPSLPMPRLFPSSNTTGAVFSTLHRRTFPRPWFPTCARSSPQSVRRQGYRWSPPTYALTNWQPVCWFRSGSRISPRSTPTTWPRGTAPFPIPGSPGSMAAWWRQHRTGN